MVKKVLIVDNDPDFLDTRVERLVAEGYSVYKAGSIAQARQILESAGIHVAIVDIRMGNDNDAKDTSGLALAEEEAYYPIPKIILTKYPSYEQVRRALGPVLTTLPPAVGFLAKQEGQEAMLHALAEAFTKYVRINSNLIINWGDWGDLRSFHHLLTLIEPESNSSGAVDQASELEDLFRKLFYDSSQITIGRLFTIGEGRAIVEVFAYGDMGQEEQLVVSFGQRWRIKAEDTGYEKFASKAAGTGSTSKTNIAETLHFAAIAYTMIGGAPAEMTSFREFYQSRSAEEVGAALNHLFTSTLSWWHQRGRFRELDKALSETYLDWLELNREEQSPAEWEHRIEGICRETLASSLALLDYSTHKLTLHLPDGTSVSYPNPADLFVSENGIELLALRGLIHGKVDADTVLVDGEARTWLIDFTHIGPGLLLRDFVSMEITIKLELLDTVDLYTRIALEQRLLEATGLTDTFPAEEFLPELRRALDAVERIRHLAAPVVSHDCKSYFVGLLCCVMKRIASYDPNIRYARRRLVPYVHGLLLAAMLYEKVFWPIRRSPHIPQQAQNSLWIDEINKEVWIEAKKIDLTPQEFKILSYLYHHAGQLCSREAMAREALELTRPPAPGASNAHRAVVGRRPEDEYGDEELEESRLNSAISRLRQKIEPDLEHPKYLITIRGHGYKLIV